LSELLLNSDTAHNALSLTSDAPATPTGGIAVTPEAETLFLDLLSRQTAITGKPLTPAASMDIFGCGLAEINVDEMAQVIVMWASRLTPNISRRDVLTKLSAAFTLAAAAPLFDNLAPDERNHVRKAIADPSQFSEPVM